MHKKIENEKIVQEIKDRGNDLNNETKQCLKMKM